MKARWEEEKRHYAVVDIHCTPGAVNLQQSVRRTQDKPTSSVSRRSTTAAALSLWYGRTIGQTRVSLFSGMDGRFSHSSIFGIPPLFVLHPCHLSAASKFDGERERRRGAGPDAHWRRTPAAGVSLQLSIGVACMRARARSFVRMDASIRFMPPFRCTSESNHNLQPITRTCRFLSLPPSVSLAPCSANCNV